MTAAPDAEAGPVTALEMAHAWSERVGAIAQHYEERERAEPGFGTLEAHIHGAGRQQFEAGQMASFMALVSIAEDLHQIRRILAERLRLP